MHKKNVKEEEEVFFLKKNCCEKVPLTVYRGKSRYYNTF